MLLALLAALLLGSGILVGVLLDWSPGDPEPFLDAAGRPVPGRISEKLRAPINGV